MYVVVTIFTNGANQAECVFSTEADALNTYYRTVGLAAQRNLDLASGIRIDGLPVQSVELYAAEDQPVVNSSLTR